MAKIFLKDYGKCNKVKGFLFFFYICKQTSALNYFLKCYLGFNVIEMCENNKVEFENFRKKGLKDAKNFVE